jgi:hypothetical protein
MNRLAAIRRAMRRSKPPPASISRDLGRWAISCYVIALLALVSLSLRTDAVTRWVEQNALEDKEATRVSEIDNLLNAFDSRSSAFAEFSAANFVSFENDKCLEAMNTVAYIRDGKEVPAGRPSCPRGPNVFWHVDDSGKSVPGYKNDLQSLGSMHILDLVSDQARSQLIEQIEIEIRRVEAGYPINPATLSVERGFLRARPYVAMAPREDIERFLRGFKYLKRSPIVRSKVALWALDGIPPDELVNSLNRYTCGTPGSTTFQQVQTGLLRSDFNGFKTYLRSVINTARFSGDLRQQISAVRVDLHRRYISERSGSGDVALSLGGVSTPLSFLYRVIPLALLGAFAVYATAYVWGPATHKPSPEESFPTFGQRFSGPSGGASKGKTLAWLVHVSLSVGVIYVVVSLARWPHLAGGGTYFQEELCGPSGFTLLFREFRFKCGADSAGPLIAAIGGVSLVCYMVRAEVEPPLLAGQRMRIFSLCGACLLAVLVLVELSHGLNKLTIAYEFSSITMNYWIGLVAMLIIIAGCGGRAPTLALVCCASLALATWPNLHKLPYVLERDSALTQEECFGPTCAICDA